MANTDPTGYLSIPPDLVRGFSWKQPARMASTGNLTLSGLQTIDGVSGADGNRILVKDNTTGSQNGLWVMHSGAWKRAFDMDQDLTTAVPAEEVMGAIVYVIAGTTNGGTFWRCSNASAPTLGTTALAFVQFAAGATLTIKDEGSALATAATSIDFVGAGVTASGTGAGKTVTVSGAPTGAAGGDLSGTYPNPSVVDDSHSHTSATVPTGATSSDTSIWRPLMDGAGNVMTDGATGEAIMSFGPA